ncbi:MAG TPA: TIGR02206 family membrane protein, partial [Rhizomicrobium sp.]
LVAALLTRRQFLYELGYFWGLGGTLQGMITPDVAYDWPDPQFLFFFVEHGGIMVALLYLTLGTGLRPRARGLPRVIAATLFYAAVAGLCDWALGVNYGFLRAKPPGTTLLSFMAPWPWYIPELVAAGILSLLVYYLPFAVFDFFYGRSGSGRCSLRRNR